MDSNTPFSCCIIGQGKLTIQCAQQLLDNDCSIKGIVSASNEVSAWARSHHLPCIHPSEDQFAFLSRWDFEHLFSIINPKKVSAPILRLPKQSAINFHDALLPKYAGLHVTSWAIANQEKSYGVTWHEMSDQFDAGDILKQIEFPIDKNDTAFSLNVQCFEKGMEAFSELIVELCNGTVSRRPQNLSSRTAYLSTKRPDAAAVINWNESGEELDAKIRSLSYQPDSNPLGLPKVQIGDSMYVIAELELVEGTAMSRPGQIVGLDSAVICVGTSTIPVSIGSMVNLDGSAVDLQNVAVRHHLKVGDTLPLLSELARKSVHHLDGKFEKYEAYWRDVLTDLLPYELAIGANVSQNIDGQAGFSERVSEELTHRLANVLPEYSPQQSLQALYCCFLQRMKGEEEVFDLSVGSEHCSAEPEIVKCLFASRIPLRVVINGNKSTRKNVSSMVDALQQVNSKGTYALDLVARTPGLDPLSLPFGIEVCDDVNVPRQLNGASLIFSIQNDSHKCQWTYAPKISTENSIKQFAERFWVFVNNVIGAVDQPLNETALITGVEQQQLLFGWNQTQKSYDKTVCIHQLIEQQATIQPGEIALIFRDSEISYGSLNTRADNLAVRLQSLGAKPDMCVGIFIDRSIEMMVGLLAILKSGAAYVPLDPAYPRDRIGLMIEDADLQILLVHSRLEKELPPHSADIVRIDDELQHASVEQLSEPQVVVATADNLAYVIYTSGSTGKPKGVMIEHKNVVNFFNAMDDVLEFDGVPGVWLAVTSISFDISVLELFWTLSRGFKVVLQEEDARTLAQPSVSQVDRKMDVGLFYFSSDAGPSASPDRYKLLIEGAKFADSHGFSSVWTPERHFHLFGGLYPNPSVTSAAVAAVTTNIAIRAGSIVLPLHNPVRVVEEWSVVDNLSGGRVGFSFASGWHANDFSLLPENYENRKSIMFENIEKVRELWSGKEITMQNGEGKPFTARIYPDPVQKEPPIWITTAGNVDSFRMAGEGGFNILTNLLGQSIDDIRDKIAAYRQGRQKNGHVGDGIVSVMVHTFVGADVEEVRELVREPFCQYLKTSFDLVKIAPWAFPAFKQPSKSAAQDPTFDADALTEEDMDALLDHAFDRYFETAGIFGTAESCLPLIDQLKTAGVDEVACLIDFGVNDEVVLDNLKHLNKLLQLANPSNEVNDGIASHDFSISAQIERHSVTHFQCTPSMARILSADAGTLNALSSLKKMLLGGEALPLDLARSLKTSLAGQLLNMYGPTETTIWSSAAQVASNPQDITIGRPIANTQIFVLDEGLNPTPVGVPGELFIGGDGVVRGYLGRPELTKERFIANPFSADEHSRMYRSGDLVRYRSNGDIEYLGRLDNQVKLRGYRIELGEIESLIAADEGVADCVVIGPQSKDETEGLIGYVVPVSPVSTAQANDANSNRVHWQAIWDETYQAGTYSDSGEHQVLLSDPMLNVSGWLDSYTGVSHPQQDMEEWVDATADRILALKPRRVLEIGCGTGMVLYRVAPHCDEYVGVDFSKNGLQLIESQISKLGWSNVRLVQSAADSLDLADTELFDLVVINSVVQYFPSADYLLNVLQHITGFIRTGGQIYVGDVRSKSLMEPFHYSLELARAPAGMSLIDVNHKAQKRKQAEVEMLLDPDFFRNLGTVIPSLAAVNIQLKRGALHNEMSIFRYDVCIDLGSSSHPCVDSDFESLMAPQAIGDVVNYLDHKKQGFVLRDIVNPRVAAHLWAFEQRHAHDDVTRVTDLHEALSKERLGGIDPEQLYQLQTPWRVELTWSKSGAAECYDAYFTPVDEQFGINMALHDSAKVMSEYAFEPIPQIDSFALVERLKTVLSNALPEFMVPEEFVVLESLPLTPNGKIDRKALPKPDKRQRVVEVQFVAPEGDIEQTIAAVLQEMLNLEKIGTRDNFSDLGANSLLMVQANSHLSRQLGRKVPLVSMYRYPTVVSLAEYLSGDVDGTEGLEKGQQRGEKRKQAQKRNSKRRLSNRKAN